MYKSILNLAGKEIASVIIEGDRIKYFKSKYPDRTLEAFEFHNNTKTTELEMDAEFTIAKLSPFSNEAKAGVTHQLICDKIPINAS